jgi:hypothetical protein
VPVIRNDGSSTLFQLLIIFHIEPHREKEGLKTGDRKEGCEQGTCCGHRSDEQSINKKIAAKSKTNRGEDETQRIKKYQGMKVSDNVFFLEPPQKEFQKKKGKGKNYFGNFDA